MSKLKNDFEVNEAIREELGSDGPQTWQLQRDCWFLVSSEKKAKITMHAGDEPGMTIEFAAVDGTGEVEEREIREKPEEQEGDSAPIEGKRRDAMLDVMEGIDDAKAVSEGKAPDKPAAKAKPKTESKKTAEPAA